MSSLDVKNLDVKLKIDGGGAFESTTEGIKITRFMVDMGVWGEAGVCEVEFTLPNTSGNVAVGSKYLKALPGKKIEISVKSPDEKYVTIFTGFIERSEVDVSSQSGTATGNNNLKFIVHGMDAKMWMMTNIQTQQHDDPKKEKKFSKIIKDALNKHKTLSGSEVSLSEDSKIKNALCQTNESDYNFLCRAADWKGYVFFIDSDGEAKFGNLTKLSKSSKTTDISKIKNENIVDVISLNYSASVYGVPTSVAVDGVNETAPSVEKSKMINANATGSSVDQTKIGEGQTTNGGIPRNAIASVTVSMVATDKEEAETSVNAICAKRTSNAVNVQVVTRGRSDVKLCSKMSLKNYGKPLDGVYIVTRIIHCFDSIARDTYTTTFELSASKINF